ncbi:MAG TPA: exosortase/archaeosortase family protein [Candidatus Limnocylindrales bacterium]|nr:exosortase/archaeosortase family protein [Candidatus Limnocylindrales bacterium]
MVVGALFVLYVPVFGHALDVWGTNQELSFGYFGPPGAAVLIFLRRKELAAAAGDGTWLGVPVLVAGLLTLVAGRAMGVHAIAGLSLLPASLGAAAYLAGLRFARLLAFPILLLTATVSLYYGLLNSVGFWLQQNTAAGAAATANLVGTGVARSGVDLFVGNNHFVVAEVCSGMSSLLALLFLGLIVAAFVTQSWPVRLLLLGSALPIVLLTNILRVTLVLVTAGTTGSNLESGAAHSLLSAGMFLCAGMLFAMTALGLRRLPRLLVS